MRLSQEITRPPIDAQFTVVGSRQILSPRTIAEGIGRQAKEHWKLTSAAFGLLALSGGAFFTPTHAIKDLVAFAHDVPSHGLVNALQRRADQIHTNYSEKCAQGEGTPIKVITPDGDVAVRERPTATSAVLARVGEGLILSVGENSKFVVSCIVPDNGDKPTAGYIGKQYTVKP